MLNFIRFTIRGFAFKFALWILYLLDEPHEKSFFWFVIDASPYVDVVISVDISSTNYSTEPPTIANCLEESHD